jgi:hypothetical protein
VSAFTAADFCDLAALARGCDPRPFGKITCQLQQQSGPMNELLVRICQSRFSFLAEQDPQIPEAAILLNAELLFAVCQLPGQIEVLADLPKTAVTKKTKTRKDGRGKREHTALVLNAGANGIDFTVEFISTHFCRFHVDADGSPRFDERLGNSEMLRDRFFDLLKQEVDLARLRKCAHSTCGRVFYAARADQLCCSARCNNARWQTLSYAADPQRSKSVIYHRQNRREGQGRSRPGAQNRSYPPSP